LVSLICGDSLRTKTEKAEDIKQKYEELQQRFQDKTAGMVFFYQTHI